MFEALIGGLGLIFQWPALGYLVLGCLIGIMLGAIPGMGGPIGLVLLLPFTFSIDPVSAFALLLSAWASSSTSGAITAVLLGVAGTAASQAMVLDGYPMAKRGDGIRALGASFTASAIGGVFGAAALGISLPLILPVILAFESPEQFMLGLLGLAMVGSLAGLSMTKGVVAALFGLLLSTIGFPELQSIPRYTFDTLYLLDKLPLVPVLLGLFAIPEVMELAIKNVSISRLGKNVDAKQGLADGVRDTLKNWWLVIRCSIMGAYIGMLPGLGAAVAGWVTYGHAKQSAKDNSQFGNGDVRGLLGPEAANNALRGGALIPTVTLGIPGSVGTAILMGALIMHGLRPGPTMLTDELPMTFSFVWIIAITSVLATLILLKAVHHVVKLALLPGHLIVPGVLFFVFMGAWLGGASIGDWISCAVFGVIGFFMSRAGWPRPPIILALVLGEILERSLQISNQIHNGIGWLSRPIVIVLILIIAITIILAARGVARDKLVSATAQAAGSGDSSGNRPAISLPISLLLFLTFCCAAYAAAGWPASVREIPMLVCIPGALLSLMVVVQDLRKVIESKKKLGTWQLLLQQASKDLWLAKALAFFGYLFGMILLTLLVGQKIALPVFIAVYLLRWGKYSVRTAIFYAFCAWLIMVLFYDRAMSLLFHASYLSLELHKVLPANFPHWLFL
jgi:TctA family transporter